MGDSLVNHRRWENAITRAVSAGAASRVDDCRSADVLGQDTCKLANLVKLVWRNRCEPLLVFGVAAAGCQPELNDLQRNAVQQDGGGAGIRLQPKLTATHEREFVETYNDCLCLAIGARVVNP